MPFTKIIAPAALTFGLLLSSAASAQTMVGDQTVSADDMAAVQTWCDKLADEATADAGVDTDDMAMSPQPDEVDNNLSGVELSTITLDQCEEAGLVEGPLPTVTQ